MEKTMTVKVEAALWSTLLKLKSERASLEAQIEAVQKDLNLQPSPYQSDCLTIGIYIRKSPREDSNLRPARYKGAALPTELHGQKLSYESYSHAAKPDKVTATVYMPH